ncbi:hypothetical protein NMY22_g1031 [Coprinellus aureogranulatus]|nr:hypothetical protein NMY22_g1031 [Coprinellus aureogranulatus]
MASSLGSDQGMHKGGTAPKDDATQGFPSLHTFAGSQGVSIGAFSATTVGRDFIHCTINNVNAPEHSAPKLMEAATPSKIVEHYEEDGTVKDDVMIGEVAYFFEAYFNGEKEGLAMVSICEEPDSAILAESHGVLWVTRLESGHNMRVVHIKDIKVVVSLLPFPQLPGRMFLFEELGLDVSYLDSTVFLQDDDDLHID